MSATTVQNIVVDSCVGGDGVLNVSFNALINQWQQGAYAIAISADCTPSSNDIWYSQTMNGSCPGEGFGVPGDGTGGNPQYLTVTTTINVTLTAGTFYVIPIAVSNTWIGSCTGDHNACSSSVSVSCGAASPTPTNTPYQSPTQTPVYSPTRTATRTSTYTQTPVLSPTRTATPSGTPTRTRTASPTRTNSPIHSPTITMTPMPATPTQTLTPIAIPMTKSVNPASATIGSTITYCISWQNNTGGATSVTIWDTVPIAMTYLSCFVQSGAMTSCSYSPRLTVFNIGASIPNGNSGVVCFRGVVSAYPWLPGWDAATWLAQLARDEDIHPQSYADFGGRP